MWRLNFFCKLLQSPAFGLKWKLFSYDDDSNDNNDDNDNDNNNNNDDDNDVVDNTPFARFASIRICYFFDALNLFATVGCDSNQTSGTCVRLADWGLHIRPLPLYKVGMFSKGPPLLPASIYQFMPAAKGVLKQTPI